MDAIKKCNVLYYNTVTFTISVLKLVKKEVGIDFM